LDLLQEQKIRAYFCLVGNKLEGRESVVRRIREDGHIIVFHSYAHENFVFKSFSTLMKDVAFFEQQISQILDEEYKVHYIRPPYGILAPGLRGKVEEEGYKVLDATHIPNDTFVNRRDGPKYLADLLKHIHKQQGGLLLLHNGIELFWPPKDEEYFDPESSVNREWLVELLPSFIQSLKEDGYNFVDLEG